MRVVAIKVAVFVKLDRETNLEHGNGLADSLGLREMPDARDCRLAQYALQRSAIANAAVDEMHRRADDAREAVDHARLAIAQVVENHGAVAGARDLDRDVAANAARAGSQRNRCAHRARSMMEWRASRAHSKYAGMKCALNCPKGRGARATP